MAFRQQAGIGRVGEAENLELGSAVGEPAPVGWKDPTSL
jgi:hypothetical protein